MIAAEWYVNWFNSPYYHLLYNNRNETEAGLFINKLCDKIQLPKSSVVWDLACGRGRHSLALAHHGYNVIGTDLSENSIHEALQHRHEKLNFLVHDMRTAFKINYFNAVFNLFTSIGYFKDFGDNHKVFKHVGASLKEKGLFIVDFFNVEKVCDTIKPYLEEQRGSITFKIKKTIVNKTIVKRIEFNENNKDYFFEETVSLLKKEDFENFAGESDLLLKNIYGDYKLNDFSAAASDRLILIFKKEK